jgi:hypothetical protein
MLTLYQSVTIADGYTSLYTPQEMTFGNAAISDRLPQPMDFVLRIHMLFNRLQSAMSDASAPTGQPKSNATVIAAFESDLYQLAIHTQRAVPDLHNVWLLSAQLQLGTLFFLEPLTSNSRRTGILKALTTATELIRTLHVLNAKPSFNHSVPHYFGQMLKLASLVILRTYYSSYGAFLDESEVHHYFDIALGLHRSMVVDPNDFHDRASVLLPDLRRIFEQDKSLQESAPVLKVRSRQSASLLHDCHWIWRDYYATRSVDTQRLGRPARSLPSIVTYSPAAPSLGGDHAAEPSLQDDHMEAAGTIPATINNTGFERIRRQIRDDNPSRVCEDSGMYDFSPDPLDMLYDFLEPGEDSSSLFYAPWSTEGNS